MGEHRVRAAGVAEDAVTGAVPLRRDSVGLSLVWVRVLAQQTDVNHLM